MDSTSGPVAFPSTQWSMVRDAGSRRRGALDALAAKYWKPVYWYVRIARGADPATAMDLAQSFFVHALETGLVGKADESRGRFRAFLKTSLRNFLADQARLEGAERRGGGLSHRSIEDAEHGAAELLEAGRELGPEAVFEREWIAAVVREASSAAERRLIADGKEAYAEAFRLYDLERVGDYRDVAKRIGRSEEDVRNYLRVARETFRECVRAEVRETVGASADLDGELAELFAWLT
jgi:RNA polymerase sigma-70 factor (ECF subfamily)